MKKEDDISNCKIMKNKTWLYFLMLQMASQSLLVDASNNLDSNALSNVKMN